jgi:hypothetical protein
MSTGSALPANWQELFSREADIPSLEVVLQLLTTTYIPNRYANLDIGALIRQMVPRQNSNGNYVAGTRVFQRIIYPPPAPPAVPQVDIAALFIVRLKYPPEAYCLTVGVATSVTSAALYSDLVGVCQYAQQTSDTTSLEIVNENALPDDLNNAGPAGQIVGGAFALAANAGHIGGPLPFSPSNPNPVPWPPNLQRWPLI